MEFINLQPVLIQMLLEIAITAAYVGTQAAAGMATSVDDKILKEGDSSVDFANKAFSPVLKTNQLQLQMATSLSPIGAAYGITTGITGYDIFGANFDESGKFNFGEKLESPDRLMNIIFSGGELKYKGFKLLKPTGSSYLKSIENIENIYKGINTGRDFYQGTSEIQDSMNQESN